MQRNGRWAIPALGLWILGLLYQPAAWAAEAVIDNFTDASALTTFVPDMNVLQGSVGSTVRNDTGLNEVIGGTRNLTVTATAIGFPGVDYVVSGVSLMPVNFFEYNSRPTANGSVTLLYNANGAGLGTDLAFAQGIQVVIREADLPAVTPGMDVTVTLTDSNMVSASQTQTVLLPVMAMSPLLLDYPFSGFAGVDESDLFSIRIQVDPGEAGDMRLNLLGTFGTPLTETICDDGIDNNNDGFIDCRDKDCVTFPPCGLKAPALSPTAMIAAFALLSLIAFGAIRRMRRPLG